MKRIVFFSLLLSLLILLSSCSLPNRLPSNGFWYNEELDISLEFKAEHNSQYSDIEEVIWNSQQDCLYAHIGYGNEICFYAIDENGTEVYLLEGHFEYSNDKFIIIASKIVEPFDIYGEIRDASDEEYTFTQHFINFTDS